MVDAPLAMLAAVLWSKDAGAGFAGPVLSGDKLLLFHRVNNAEVVECMEAESGKTVWKAEYPSSYRDDFGFDEGPRASPVAAEGRVFTHGAEGVLQALDLATGKRLWSVQTMTRYGVEKNFFGAAGSPLVAGNVVMLNVGGKNGTGIVGFDAASGKELWHATDDGAGYSTGRLSGGKAYFLTRAGLVVLDPTSGKVFHQMRWRSRSNASVNAASPVVVNDEVFLSASYGTGATLLKTSEDWKQVWASDDSLSNHYATSVYKDGYLYGFHGRQETGQDFRCIEWKTGKVMWSKDGYGAGTVTLDGARLVLVRENGEIVVADASPTAFRPKSAGRALSGVVRAYPALSGNLIWLRNENKVAAIRLE